MKTREEEKKEDIEAGEIIRAIFVTVATIYTAGALFIFGAFYALGAGIAVFIAGLWSSHLYYKWELKTINIKKA